MSLRSRVAFVLLFSGSLYLSNAVSCLAKVNRHDTVIMNNGDRLTGEVKRLEEGVLYIQTDYFSGSVGVDWLQVEEVESKATFQIVLSNGKRLAGSISKVEATTTPGKDVVVRAEGVEVSVAGTDVVEIESQKQTFGASSKAASILATTTPAATNSLPSIRPRAPSTLLPIGLPELPTLLRSAGSPVAPQPTCSTSRRSASVISTAIPT